MGTNMGLWKMAEVSGLSYSSLLTTAHNFLRTETLHAGNNGISNATAKLPMFQQYDIDEQKHSSSDGQHIETQINTINARHGSKYFGLKKGVSAYTMVFNHVPCNAKVIGTHEHESHFVFDILHNNTTDIRPERHSTDTHGANQVNYIILDVAPTPGKTRPRKHYGSWIIVAGRTTSSILSMIRYLGRAYRKRSIAARLTTECGAQFHT